MAKIVVVGAGVVGLTTALELLRLPIRHEVTIVAAQVPGDFDFGTNYTSPYAGANWDSFATKDDIEQQEIDAIGYKKFKKLLKNPEAGIVARDNYHFITNEKFKAQGNKQVMPWFADFEDCNLQMVPYFDHNKFAYAFKFDGFVITTTYYLPYLWAECNRTGRFNLIRKELSTLDEAWDCTSDHSKADIVVNCSGLRARELVPDPEMYPVRGLVMLIENTNNVKDVCIVETAEPEHPDEELYFMPRKEGGLIIGGCFQENNTQKEPDEAQIKRILGRTKKYLPELDWPEEIKIVRKQVGFRPFRKSGFRIEADPANSSLIHCYGHGGAGYQASWGSADRVVKLVEKTLLKKRVSSKF